MSERDKQNLARVAWLQSLVSHRIVPSTFAKHLYQKCCAISQTPYDDAAYHLMLDESSIHLSALDLEIRTFRDQSSGQEVLALVNTKHDTFIQGATRYSALEISFIKKLVEEIFKARREAYAIPSLEAVRLGSKLRTHMTRDATEELLKNLVNHRWIDYSEDGIYTLSTRSLLELRNYLQNEFGEEHYHTCTHCKDLVTIGVGCSATSRGCTPVLNLSARAWALALLTLGVTFDESSAESGSVVLEAFNVTLGDARDAERVELRLVDNQAVSGRLDVDLSSGEIFDDLLGIIVVQNLIEALKIVRAGLDLVIKRNRRPSGCVRDDRGNYEEESRSAHDKLRFDQLGRGTFSKERCVFEKELEQ
uniref:Non-structural maintenance of chromosomes element 1 homolog n=1 Tax=Melanopsichium pennsylvanicum 4 TaxID=1398559 RepID=A0A077R7S3_9BASI|nr:conserved hypothetical protein [Melanopsichium pennsylvanicum 4]